MRLPDPALHSMRSDGFVEPSPLRKSSCLSCGCVFRTASLAFHSQVPTDDYTLNVGVENSFGRTRQQGYANAIAGAAGRPPARLVDVGCGNGALLECLRAMWPQAECLGVEPAALPRAQAASKGLRVWARMDRSWRGDLAVSVNVIEHTADPAAFLRRIAAALQPGGRCVLIWPADLPPSTELLFNDHLYTLPASLVVRLAAIAGLSNPVNVTVASGFQGLLLHKAGRARKERDGRRRSVTRSALLMSRSRVRYLRRWAALAAELLSRVDPSRELVAFGTGEAAQTLRAYAPALWNHVTAVTMDEPTDRIALGLPLLEVAQLDAGRHQLLLAVHPRSHDLLRARFERAGFPCLGWDHLVQN